MFIDFNKGFHLGAMLWKPFLSRVLNSDIYKIQHKSGKFWTSPLTHYLKEVRLPSGDNCKLLQNIFYYF